MTWSQSKGNPAVWGGGGSRPIPTEEVGDPASSWQLINTMSWPPPYPFIQQVDILPQGSVDLHPVTPGNKHRSQQATGSVPQLLITDVDTDKGQGELLHRPECLLFLLIGGKVRMSTL